MTEEDLVNPDEPGLSEEAIDGSPGLPEEVVDGLPVLAEVRQLEPAPAAPLPAAQAAAVAATGFLAGAATFALVKHRRTRKLARAGGAVSRPLISQPPLDLLPVAGSRTYLVHVRVLAKPGE